MMKRGSYQNRTMWLKGRGLKKKWGRLGEGFEKKEELDFLQKGK